MILGDNFIYGNELDAVLEKCKTENGATVLSYPVKDPERFGVVEFDSECKVTSIEEKPDKPKSNQLSLECISMTKMLLSMLSK